MSDLAEQKREELFNNIRDALVTLEDGTLDDIARTHVIFDVLEQLMARTIAGTVVDDDSLEKTCQQSFDNIKKMATTFLSADVRA